MATHERVTITRHGRPAAVQIAVDDLEALEETLFWQSQPRIHQDLEMARIERKEGRLYDEAAVRQRYGAARSAYPASQ